MFVFFNRFKCFPIANILFPEYQTQAFFGLVLFSKEVTNAITGQKEKTVLSLHIPTSTFLPECLRRTLAELVRSAPTRVTDQRFHPHHFKNSVGNFFPWWNLAN